MSKLKAIQLYPLFVQLNIDDELVVPFEDTEFYAEQVYTHYANNAEAISFAEAESISEHLLSIDIDNR